MSGDKELDKKDLTIVQLLREDAWLTHAKIGEAVHLSPSAVQRRIERLRETGVITGASATVDPSALKRPFRAYLLLELHNDGAKALDELAASLRARPEVTALELLLGQYDILLTVDCDDTEHFSDFAMDALNKNENIKHCSTLTRLKELL